MPEPLAGWGNTASSMACVNRLRHQMACVNRLRHHMACVNRLHHQMACAGLYKLLLAESNFSVIVGGP